MQRVASSILKLFAPILYRSSSHNERTATEKKKKNWTQRRHMKSMRPSHDAIDQNSQSVYEYLFARKERSGRGETDGGTLSERKRERQEWVTQNERRICRIFKLLFGCAWNMIMSVTYVKSILWQFLYNSHLHISARIVRRCAVGGGSSFSASCDALFETKKKDMANIEFWLVTVAINVRQAFGGHLKRLRNQPIHLRIKHHRTASPATYITYMSIFGRACSRCLNNSQLPQLHFIFAQLAKLWHTHIHSTHDRLTSAREIKTRITLYQLVEQHSYTRT